MAEEGSVKERESASPINSVLINANGRDKWEPAKYQRMGLYVFLYNYIKQNLPDFQLQADGSPSKYGKDFGLGSGAVDSGLTTSDILSVQIDKCIKNNLDWFFEFFKVNDPTGTGVGDDNGLDMGINKDVFVTEMDQYVSESERIVSSGKLPSRDGGMLTVEEMRQVLTAKEEAVRKYFEDVRIAVDGREGDLDPKTGKPKGGYLYTDMIKVEQERKEILSKIAANSGNILFKSLVTAGGAGLTIASGLSLLSYTGIAIGAGAALVAASPVGMAIASAVGLIVGVKVTKTAITKLLGAIGKEAGLIKDHFEFIHGYGKYAPDKDGIPKGYNARVNRYEKICELKRLMTKFKIPDKAEDFEREFNKFYDDFARNAKYSTEEELAPVKKKIMYLYQVTNGTSVGRGGSAFGRVRNLMSRGNVIEAVNYKMSNPHEILRHYEKAIKDPNLGIGQVKKQIQNFEDTKTHFENANSINGYREMLTKFNAVVMSALENTAFSETLTSNTSSNLVNATTDATLKERIDSGVGDAAIARVKNMAKFIDTESSGNEKTLGTELDVNVKNQMSFTKEAMIDACSAEAFGLDSIMAETSPHKISVQKIASFIEGYKIDGQDVEIDGTNYGLSAIESMLDSFLTTDPTNLSAYKYLSFMLEKKKKMAVLDEDNIKVNIIGSKALSNYAGNLTARTKSEIDASCNDLGLVASTVALSVNVDDILALTPASDLAEIDRLNQAIGSINSEYKEVKQYLTYILNRQIGKTATYENIASEIANLSVADEPTEVPSKLRDKIMRSALSSTAKENAVNALNNQIGRLEELRRQNARTKVLKMFQSGGDYYKLNDVMDKIDAIKYDTCESDEVKEELYKKIIMNAPDSVKDYLDVQFRRSVERAISKKIDDEEDTLRNGTAGLEKARELLQKIATYSYLDQVQKDRLTNEITTYLQNAFSISLQNMEREILNYSGKNTEFTEVLRKYLEEGYVAGGFKSFFDSPTPESDEVRHRIENLANNSGILGWIVPNALYGSGQNARVVDKDSNDTRFIVSAYFKNPELGRSDTDGLRTCLTTIHNIYANSSSSITALPADVTDKNNFIYQMTEAFVDIESTITSDADKLAAYMSAKKHILEMYRYQLYKFFGESIGTNSVTNKYNKYDPSGRREIEFINDPWIDLIRIVDSKCNSLKKSTEVTSNRNLASFTDYQNGEETIRSYNSPEKIIKYMNNNEHTQPNLY